MIEKPKKRIIAIVNIRREKIVSRLVNAVVIVFHFRRKPIWADGPRLTQIYYSPQIRLSKECR